MRSNLLHVLFVWFWITPMKMANVCEYNLPPWLSVTILILVWWDPQQVEVAKTKFRTSKNVYRCQSWALIYKLHAAVIFRCLATTYYMFLSLPMSLSSATSNLSPTKEMSWTVFSNQDFKKCTIIIKHGNITVADNMINFLKKTQPKVVTKETLENSRFSSKF